MSNAEGIHPQHHEIERQLERILADDVIASHPQPAKLLEFIVRHALGGKEVTEQIIREFVFPTPPYKEDSNIARITMQKVRSLLAEYNSGRGGDDPVIITLPEVQEGKRIKFLAGRAYTPDFRYNPRNEIAKEFAIANHLLRGSPAQIEQGLQHLENIRAEHSEHPDVILGGAEAIASKLLLGMYEESRETLVAAFLDWTAKIAPEVPRYWRLPMVRGLLYFCGGNQDEAAKEFEKALALDRQFTLSRGWYTHFLFATGRQEEAVQQLGLEADERVNNSQAQALHGIYLCQTSRFTEAECVLSKALELDRNCWISHYGMTLLYVSTGRREHAERQATMLRALLEPEDFALATDQLRRLLYDPPGS